MYVNLLWTQFMSFLLSITFLSCCTSCITDRHCIGATRGDGLYKIPSRTGSSLVFSVFASSTTHPQCKCHISHIFTTIYQNCILQTPFLTFWWNWHAITEKRLLLHNYNRNKNKHKVNLFCYYSMSDDQLDGNNSC